LIVQGSDKQLVALVLRGDHELNKLKAEKLPQLLKPLQFASKAAITSVIGCQTGFIGPVGLKMPMIVDRSAAHLVDFTCGANQQDKHYSHANWDNDVGSIEIADLRNVVTNDPSPDGQGNLLSCRGIEVGHIFQLGDKYSKTMNATVLDENGETVTPLMGCYGLGVSRIVAAAIEQNHDQRGIIWPQNIAPFEIALLPINAQKSKRVQESTETIYTQLIKAGFDVLLDDRNERPGSMFADMDLIGIPHRLVLSEKGLDVDTIEYKQRRNPDIQHIPLTSLITFLRDPTLIKTQ